MKKNIDYSEERRKELEKYLLEPHTEVPTYQDMIDRLAEKFKTHLESTNSNISKSTISRDLNYLGYEKLGNEWIKGKDIKIKEIKENYKKYLIGKFYTYSVSKWFSKKIIAYFRKNIKIEGITQKSRLFTYSLTLLVEPGYEIIIGKLIYDTYSYERNRLSIIPGIGCIKIETTSKNLFTEINKDSKVPKKNKKKA